MARFVQTRATMPQFAEFAAHRSIYHLKEADPHTWAIPRLHGRAKAALIEIQMDEHGDGDPNRMHSALFAKLLRGVGLEDTYGAYVDSVPAITLAISNVMSMFGLRREPLGALAGHLAAYEMTSSAPCRRYAKGLRRLGADDATCDFYDADAAACLYVDTRFAEHVLGAAVAQRLERRPAAPAERDYRSGVDEVAVLVADLDAAAQDERDVGVHGDGRHASACCSESDRHQLT